MEEELKKYIENIFRESSSSDEIFDAFKLAISNKIDDPELYKILLANLSLSKDEIIMFSEKASEEFSELGYELFLWTANIFENRSDDYNNIENSLYYYQKAFLVDPEMCLPLISALRLYNYDIDLPTNKNVLQLVNTGVETTNNKSRVYLYLADHFGKLGDKELMNKYKRLAAEAGKSRD